MQIKQLYKPLSLYDIICCQTKKSEKRLTINIKSNEFNISDESYFSDIWYDIKEPLKCPNCEQKIPEHIMLQFKILGSE